MSFDFTPRLRLTALVWALGMLGAMAVVILHVPTMLPALLKGRSLPMSMAALQAISILQFALLVGLAAWVGAVTAPAVGLRAPGLEAAARGQPVFSTLVPQLRPGFGYGLCGGLFLFVVNALGPDAWVAAQKQYYPGLPVRLLFGGITEEVLLRWGLMSAAVWALWRIFQRDAELPRRVYVWSGIFISAVLFAIAHLPAVASAVGSLDVYLAVYIVGGNALAGGLFGWLYWRYGLECAIVAHASAHLINYLLGLM